MNALAVLEMVHVNDWIVSRFGLAPCPLTVRPTVLAGPVVETREVSVLLMKEEKMAAGLLVAE